MNPQLHRLRVALIASSLRRGGGEKQAVAVARALFEAGVNLRFYYLGGGGYHEAGLREMGVPIRQIYRPNMPWRMLAKLTRELRRFQPHVVLALQYGDLRFAAPAGRFCKALTLGYVQCDGWYELRTYGRSGRLMVRLAHGLVSSSHHARNILVSQRFDARKIEVVPNLLDLRDFDARSVLPFPAALPPDRVIVAAVGSLQPCKRFDRFLEALALARRSEPGLTGVIAGADLGERRALEERARALRLAPPDLFFLGECHCVPALLARAAMLVLSSEYEGLPNVVLEAMAARLPVITTRVGDAGVVAQHGDTGYVVEPDDIQSMAAYMVRLAQSPSTRTALGEAGRKRVEQEYNYESLSSRLMASFQSFARQTHNAALVEMLERGVPGAKPIAYENQPA
jgi:glycosyltransferase involved in cell wall biosynthesis